MVRTGPGDTIQLLGMVSTSDFSSIFVAKRASDDGVVVVKSFNHAAHNADAGTRILNERALLELVNCRPHAFVVGFRFALADSTFAYLAMDNVGGGDFYSLLQRNGPFPPHAAKLYIAEVVLALAHLHSFDVVHRDVKPENILIDLDGHIKLADLGSAKRMLGRIGAMPPPANDATLCGTPEYMAPEMLLAQLSCEDADVWSTGCLLSETIMGKSPFAVFDGNVETLVFNIVHRPIELPRHDNLGAEECEVLTGLLRRTPHERLGARANGGVSAIVEHPWFGGVSAKAFLTKQVPAPWVPHLGGPAPHVPPPTDLLLDMADAALHPPLPPPEDAYAPPSCFGEFGGRVTIEVGPPPPTLPHHPVVAPQAPPSPPPSAPASSSLASLSADDEWSDDEWSDDEEAAHGESVPSSGRPVSAPKHDNETDESPASILDAAQLERRREAPVAAGFQIGSRV